MKFTLQNIMLTFGITVGFLIILAEFSYSRENKESFIENMELYKIPLQTFRKCNRETSRYAKNKIDGFKTDMKRMFRKRKI
jgi:hypothetical protein